MPKSNLSVSAMSVGLTDGNQGVDFFPQSEFVADIMMPAESQTLYFYLNGVERLRICPDGIFYVNGEPVEHNDGAAVYEAAKEFFEKVSGRG